jgi:hypothetical protein
LIGTADPPAFITGAVRSNLARGVGPAEAAATSAQVILRLYEI